MLTNMANIELGKMKWLNNCKMKLFKNIHCIQRSRILFTVVDP